MSKSEIVQEARPDLEDLILPPEVKKKIIEGLRAINSKFWQKADVDDICEFMLDIMIYGDKGKLPYVYRTHEELVEALLEHNVDATLEFFFITPTENTRAFPIEAIKLRLAEQRKAAVEADQKVS